MNLLNYFRRIDCDHQPTVTSESLITLHREHVLKVPFENLDVVNKVPVILDQERIFHKIVENRRGGFCYEQNSVFNQVLEAIGFESYFISCNVYVPPVDKFAPDFGHLAIVVTLENAHYLVDVGFGDAFIEPLKLSLGEVQYQYGIYYRLKAFGEGEVLLEKSLDGEQYQKMFKFSLTPRNLEEFSELCQFHQMSPMAPFNKQYLCTRPTPEGRITLTSNSLTVTTNKTKQEISVEGNEAFNELLIKYFDITLDPSLKVPYKGAGEVY